MSWTEIFVLLFVTIGPVRSTIAFADETRAANAALKRKMAIRVVVAAAIVCVGFALLGAGILANWRVEVNALLIAGGILLFLSAKNSILNQAANEIPDEKATTPSLNTATYPLAVPTMASPHGLVAIAAIEATLMTSNDTGILIGLILGIMVINLVFLLFLTPWFGKISRPVLNLILCVLGLLLSAMAVQLVIFGFDGLGLIPNPDIDLNN